MKKAAVIGHFGGNEEFFDGQTVKTKTLTAELEKEFGKKDILKIDTHGRKILLQLPLLIFLALKKCENVVIFPAQNSLRIIPGLLCFFNRFFNRHLYYSVIGGWLSSFLKDKKRLSETLKKFDAIYVETSTMKYALENIGFTNIEIMPNCKNLTPICESELVYPDSEPYKLCTFSRVMKEKGIGDAVNAVKQVNEYFNRTVYTLDIYGQIDSSQTEWFDEIRKNFPEYVRYGGCVDFDKSVEVLKDYFALLFPTRFYTEGIPGTFIDAYAAGVPVITSMWMNCDDVFEEGVTGWGYNFDETSKLTELLIRAAEIPNDFLKMKTMVLSASQRFQSSVVIKTMTKKM